MKLPNFTLCLCSKWWQPTKRTILVALIQPRNCFSSSKYSEEDEDEKKHLEFVNKLLPAAIARHSVLVVQPYVKWGEAKRRNTTPELQASEAATLVGSLPKWRVEEKIVVPLRSLNKKSLFGSGSLDMLKEKVARSKRITAVFISVDNLQYHQHKELESMFRVPVFDRYMIVIQIFRMRAITKEAKLQVAMAELPFLWSRLKDLPPGSTSDNNSNSEDRKKFLMHLEAKMKRQLQKLRGQREILRKNRSKFPIVAVVGYTNAGKTSLIKALTNDKSLEPRDELFSTLDVTSHAGTLPCQLKVLYVDSVGFISDIPTTLIESFVATLEDAMLADVILHVRDVSHPDCKAQNDDVIATLNQFNLPVNVMENIITAGNKVDLLDSTPVPSDDFIPVSALHNTGIVSLQEAIQKAVLKATGRVAMVIRVPSGGEEMRWLYKESAVSEVQADPNNEAFTLMHVVISREALSRFRHCFVQ